MGRTRRSSLFWLLGVAMVALVVWGASGLIARGRPKVLGFFPDADAIAVPAFAPLRVTFDRQMSPSGTESALLADPPRPGTFEWQGNTLVFTPDSPWPRGETITVTLLTAARTSGGIPLAQPLTWSFRTAPTLLAYLWPADAPADLYALDPNSGETVRFTESENGVLDFSLAPDGLSLLLSLANPDGGADIAALDLLERTVSQVLDCGGGLCRNPVYRPDGSLIAYEEITSQSVYLVGAAGGDPERLGSGRFPVWSSEGLLLYYDPEQQAYTTFNPGTRTTSLYPNEDGEPPAWQPSGGAFMAADILEIGENALTGHLMHYPVFGTEGEDRTVDPNADDISPVYSPDGRLVAFARRYQDAQRWTPGRQLWLMSSDGQEPRQLSDAPLYNHTAFAWSPDGTQIAYLRSNQADLNEPPEIWLLDMVAGSQLRILINGFAPQWLP